MAGWSPPSRSCSAPRRLSRGGPFQQAKRGSVHRSMNVFLSRLCFPRRRKRRSSPPTCPGPPLQTPSTAQPGLGAPTLRIAHPVPSSPSSLLKKLSAASRSEASSSTPAFPASPAAQAPRDTVPAGRSPRVDLLPVQCSFLTQELPFPPRASLSIFLRAGGWARAATS